MRRPIFVLPLLLLHPAASTPAALSKPLPSQLPLTPTSTKPPSEAALRRKQRDEALAVRGNRCWTPTFREGLYGGGDADASSGAGMSGSVAASAAKVPRGGAAALVMAPGVKLLVGAGGIYAAFMYYGLLQEDVFRYASADGTKFTQAWFLQTLEALANVIVGFFGMMLTGATKNLPLLDFAMSGAAQVSAKTFTSKALAAGVSFPVVTLAKSGKMVPVMLGSILLGGATYSFREYSQVLAIIGGTCLVSMAKKKAPGGPSSVLGLVFIMLSLTCDGVVGGLQKRLKASAKSRGVVPKPYDFMFWTNLFMMVTAVGVSFGVGEFLPGAKFVMDNPEILSKIVKFALCSAVGQSFIFFTIANFEPLVCTTVTTTRKIFSVLLSIFLKGHQLNAQGWAGIGVACLGILGELEDKMSRSRAKTSPPKEA